MSNLKVASIFSSNMVLQRKKNIKIWGTGNDNDKVTVTISNNTVNVKVVGKKWMAELPSMEAGGPYVVKVTNGENLITFENVMIGEVWLAGGQSNMELEIQNSKNGKVVVSNVNNR